MALNGESGGGENGGGESGGGERKWILSFFFCLHERKRERERESEAEKGSERK
jgi:hypothetical protein